MTSSQWPHGAPFWAAQLGPDVEGAKAFYGALFGWSFENIAGADAPPFYIASADGVRVASLTGPQDPAVWIVAVAVSDLDQARRDAAGSGGTAPGESVDIDTLGRFHRLHDPAGAEIHVASPLERSNTARSSAPGTWSSVSLNVEDWSTVASFYETLFGWRAHASGTTTAVIRHPDHVPSAQAVGIAVEAPNSPTAPASTGWIPAFRVADVDVSVRTALANGGRQVADVTTSANTRSALVADPNGAEFAIEQRHHQ